MNCEAFEQFYDKAEFRDHLAACADCRKRFDEYQALSLLARGLKREVEAPLLWTRIENLLLQEKATRSRWRKGILAAGLAAAVLLMVLPPMVLMKAQSASILGDVRFASLLEEEQDLTETIRKMESSFHDALEKREDKGSSVLHRLEYVDWNLENCRRASKSNRMNIHVRHALLACYQKKLEIMRGTLSQ